MSGCEVLGWIYGGCRCMRAMWETDCLRHRLNVSFPCCPVLCIFRLEETDRLGQVRYNDIGI